MKDTNTENGPGKGNELVHLQKRYVEIPYRENKTKQKLCGFSLQANYTNRAKRKHNPKYLFSGFTITDVGGQATMFTLKILTADSRNLNKLDGTL